MDDATVVAKLSALHVQETRPGVWGEGCCRCCRMLWPCATAVILEQVAPEVWEYADRKGRAPDFWFDRFDEGWTPDDADEKWAGYTFWRRRPAGEWEPTP